MLVLKPKGRGRWAPVTVRIEGKRAAPLLVKAGELFRLGGIEWRVCEVKA